jgi:IS4 transposase
VKGPMSRNMTQQKISKLGFPERVKYWTFNIKTGLQNRTLNLKTETLIKSLKEYLFLLFYLVSLATNFFLLWPLKFEFGHQNFGVGDQLATKIKIPLWGLCMQQRWNNNM